MDGEATPITPSDPTLTWINGAGDGGRIADHEHLAILVRRVGSNRDWAWMRIDSSDGGVAQVTGRHRSYILELSRGDQLRLVAPRDAASWPRFDIAAPGFSYYASLDELLDPIIVVALAYTHLLEDVIPDSYELRDTLDRHPHP